MKHILMIWKKRTPVQKISLSFLGLIFLGSFLLCLPFSHHGASLSYLDALFVSCSATCVTGLSTITVASELTLIGKIILLVLIQIGGLGLMTLVASIMLLLRNKLSLYDKIAMKEVLNLSNMIDFKSFLHGIIKYVAGWELIGTLGLSIALVPKMGLKGIPVSLFTSVSAFCNAGFDVFGDSSVIPYQDNMLVMITLMILIIMGGIGFMVWFDIKDKVSLYIKERKHLRIYSSKFTLHTKIVLVANFVLIVIPAIVFFFTEYNNGETLGHMPFLIKIVNALFHSITLRTAGFASIPCGSLRPSSQLLMYIVMFIGGSPGGTAGGIKTTTIAVLLISMVSYLKGREKTTVWKRHIPRSTIVQATNLILINLVVLFIGIFILTISETLPYETLVFEGVSALATVGLSMGITASLSVIGKIVIIFMMYFGRIGITTFIYSIMKEDNAQDIIQYPEGHVVIG